MLTAVCRKLLKQAPLHAISATKAGSGKGTLAKGVSILLIDNHAGTIPFTGDSEEFRKKITSFLKSGQPIGLIDNVTGILGGDVLEMVLTEPFFKDRLLGGNQIPSFSTQTVLLANGNNLRFRPDMTRRALLSVLDSQLENPEHRIFDRDFERFTRTNRGKLVAAALTILKAYIVEGFPGKKQPRLGSFESWSDLVRSSLIWLAQPDPVETQAEIRAQDDERQTLLALLQSWHDSYKTVPQTAKEVCLRAVQSGRGDLRDTLIEVALDRKGDISPRKLGCYLRTHCRSVIGKLRFEADGEDRLGATRWKVTVLPPSQKPYPASPAQTAETTQNQADSSAGYKNPSPAPTCNGRAEDVTLQDMENLSPAPSNNAVLMVCGTSAGDAGHSSSGPSEIVSSEEDVSWTQEEVDLKERLDAGQTVVANKNRHKHLVEWAFNNNRAQYIGRGSRWGNDFIIGKNGDRDSVIRQYIDKFWSDKQELHSQVKDLKGKVLVCYCAPQPCHGDFLAEKAEEVSHVDRHLKVGDRVEILTGKFAGLTGVIEGYEPEDDEYSVAGPDYLCWFKPEHLRRIAS